MNQQLYEQAHTLTKRLYDRLIKSVQHGDVKHNYEYHTKLHKLYRKSQERERRRFWLWYEKAV